MELNADVSRRAIVHAGQHEWVPSPMAGVHRRMLERIGEEVARATSIVRYAKGSSFSAHTHGGGEEFFVLEGTFEDEHGAYPAGTYVRNPPGTTHTPGASDGCTILVKLWQFDPQDRNQFSIDTTRRPFATDPARADVEIMTLHEDAHETVRLERYAPGAQVPLAAPGGVELLVLDGGFTLDGEGFSPQSWLRLPPGDGVTVTAGSDGARVWMKRDHLAAPLRTPPA